MIFTETALAGAFVIEADRFEDERGFFARTYLRGEFEARGLDPQIAQCAVSFNRRRATLRGLHYQAAPHAQAKLVRCSRGAIYDVIVDLRAGSPSFHGWLGVELSAANLRALYVPAGCAHGFETLEDESEVLYSMSAAYHPPSERGVRWDDPAFGIRWPLPPLVISERDRSFPLLDAARLP